MTTCSWCMNNIYVHVLFTIILVTNRFIYAFFKMNYLHGVYVLLSYYYNTMGTFY